MKTIESRQLLIFILLFFCFEISTIFGQSNNETAVAFVDEKPIYKKWQREYIITKIVYADTETIFYFKFKPTKKYKEAIFYPIEHSYSWLLVDHKNKRTYHPISIQNVRKNGELISDKVEKEELRVYAKEPKNEYTCTIHFERFSKEVLLVDLIEGLGQEDNKDHFNFFKIELKPIWHN